MKTTVKKQYVSPKCKVVKCSVANIIAASLNVYSNEVDYYTEEQY